MLSGSERHKAAFDVFWSVTWEPTYLLLSDNLGRTSQLYSMFLHSYEFIVK
jgi:hypothetical protein